MKQEKVKSTASSPRTSPRDVFLHLLMMAMLYIVVISLITLSFSYINYSFPDLLDYYRSGLLDSIRIQSSMLVVAFPLFLVLSSLVQKVFRKNPAKHNLTFRKWLIYLTLFIAAITIVIDLIQLVNRFYGGELTLPFVLKVVSVLIVAGGVFGYYLWDVQSEPHKSKVPRNMALASSFVVLVMLVSGFFIVGSPAHQRQIRMDERRVSDLQSIQGQIINYWQLKDELPAKLELLEDDITGFRVPVDPETESGYEYELRGDLEFSLCASFNLKSNVDSNENSRIATPYIYDYGYPPKVSEVWDHEPGRVCFDRSIDPELFPEL